MADSLPTPPVAKRDYSPSSMISTNFDPQQLLPPLERLLKNATSQLSEIAQIWTIVARASSSAIGFSSEDNKEPVSSMPFAITINSQPEKESPAIRGDETLRVEKTSAQPASVSKRKGRLFKIKSQKASGQPSNSLRQRPDLKDKRICPDCFHRGSGSRSQSGLIYFYCRNGKCIRGTAGDKFIGWANT